MNFFEECVLETHTLGKFEFQTSEFCQSLRDCFVIKVFIFIYNMIMFFWFIYVNIFLIVILFTRVEQKDNFCLYGDCDSFCFWFTSLSLVTWALLHLQYLSAACTDFVNFLHGRNIITISWICNIQLRDYQDNVIISFKIGIFKRNKNSFVTMNQNVTGWY